MTPQEFIAALSAPAQQSMLTTKIPASFVVADAALESGWGVHAPGFNLFGVKADPSWTGAIVTLNTREFWNGKWVMIPAKFRAYSGWLGSIEDHAAFLLSNPRYGACFACQTPQAFAEAIAKAGYATDPSYAQKIIEVMRAHNLQQLDQPQGTAT